MTQPAPFRSLRGLQSGLFLIVAGPSCKLDRRVSPGGVTLDPSFVFGACAELRTREAGGSGWFQSN
jgi:hypothetical protein